jgi:hypothetical protein
MLRNTAIRPLRACLFVSALAVAGTGSAPVFAASPYDGSWSVVITTQVGACEPTVRYGLQIVDGAVIAASGGVADVSGRVSPRGFVNVTVRSGNAWAAGSGRLSRQTGSGSWRGEGSSGACQGSWVAERTGGPGEAANPGAPVYNYAPGAVDER